MSDRKHFVHRLVNIFPAKRHWLLVPLCIVSGFTANCGPEEHSQIRPSYRRIIDTVSVVVIISTTAEKLISQK